MEGGLDFDEVQGWVPLRGAVVEGVERCWHECMGLAGRVLGG